MITTSIINNKILMVSITEYKIIMGKEDMEHKG